MSFVKDETLHCRAIMFITRIRFPPGKSLATILEMIVCHLGTVFPLTSMDVTGCVIQY